MSAARERTGDPRIAARIRAARVAKGWRQQDLASAVHCEEAYISQLETGRNHPSVPMIGRMARAMGVTTDYLIFGTKKTQTSRLEETLMELVASVDPKDLRRLARTSKKVRGSVFELLRAIDRGGSS